MPEQQPVFVSKWRIRDGNTIEHARFKDELYTKLRAASIDPDTLFEHPPTGPTIAELDPERSSGPTWDIQRFRGRGIFSVSYTHLTLPTKA